MISTQNHFGGLSCRWHSHFFWGDIISDDTGSHEVPPVPHPLLFLGFTPSKTQKPIPHGPARKSTLTRLPKMTKKITKAERERRGGGAKNSDLELPTISHQARGIYWKFGKTPDFFGFLASFFLFLLRIPSFLLKIRYRKKKSRVKKNRGTRMMMGDGREKKRRGEPRCEKRRGSMNGFLC